MEKIVIIGGVAAGATAAAKVRRLSADAEITILEAGADISFANCGLPYYIGGDIKSRSKLILQSPESFNDEYQTAVYIHTSATEIDRANKIVHTVNSKTGEKKQFEYTKLILAQGGKPIAPPLPGADQDHVFQLWTLDDMDRINAFISNKKPKTAVVVGGGFIGLEMTEALAKRGMKVSVVEMMPHVMGIMEAEIAGFIQEELMAYGVDLHTNKALAEIHANTVLLKDGTRINADMVLLSIGVRPDT
jgi:NADPH-dependent 2,4-dienoyl-CoA reductase/sulfur reductase-like enzyme